MFAVSVSVLGALNATAAAIADNATMSIEFNPVVVDPGWNIFIFEWWAPVWMHHLLPLLPKESDTQCAARFDCAARAKFAQA